jgi:nucleoside-diphosphate-sugar epimerase
MNVNLNTKAVLVTGSSGFIGANLVINLLKSYETYGLSVLTI